MSPVEAVRVASIPPRAMHRPLWIHVVLPRGHLLRSIVKSVAKFAVRKGLTHRATVGSKIVLECGCIQAHEFPRSCLPVVGTTSSRCSSSILRSQQRVSHIRKGVLTWMLLYGLYSVAAAEKFVSAPEELVAPWKIISIRRPSSSAALTWICRPTTEDGAGYLSRVEP